MGSPPETEILVHIAAPAGARDDGKYRALARAYLGFEPVNRVTVHADTSSADAPAATFIASPNLSFSGALDNLRSPRPQHPGIPLERTAETPERELGQNHGSPASSFLTPPSVVPDSFPNDHTTIQQFVSPTRVLEFILSAPAVSSSDASELPINGPSITSPQQTRSTANAAAGSTPRKDGPDTRASAHTHAVDASAHAVTNGYRNPLSTGQSDVGGLSSSRPSPPCMNCLAGSALKPKVGCGDLSHSTNLQQTKPVKTTPASSSSLPPFRHSNRMELCGPEPKVGTGEVNESSILTPKLVKVYRDMGKDKTLGRLKWKRELRKFERGHWVVDISTWGHEQKTRTWEFLANYIRRGEAGWGVMCRRDEAWSRLRFWCFGAVVAHIFLVLYVASRKEILALRHVSWIAGNGDAVVVLQPRGRA